MLMRQRMIQTALADTVSSWMKLSRIAAAHVYIPGWSLFVFCLSGRFFNISRGVWPRFLSDYFFPTSWSVWDFVCTLWEWWRRKWQPTPVLLPGESHGRRSLVACSLWGCTESDTTERLHFTRFTHFILYHWRRKWQPTPVFLSGESHGQRSLAGRGPWVAESWTWLKWLSMHAFESGVSMPYGSWLS